MNAVTQARIDVVDALAAAGIDAYGFTPPTLIPPIAVVQAGSPWLEPDRIGGDFAATISMRIECIVNLIETAAAIVALEDLVVRVLAALPKGILPTSVEAPAIGGNGSQGDTLQADILITAHIKE
jgi:hypothetical protein